MSDKVFTQDKQGLREALLKRKAELEGTQAPSFSNPSYAADPGLKEALLARKKQLEEEMSVKKGVKDTEDSWLHTAGKKAKRYAGMGVRTAASGLASVGDLPALAGNAVLWGAEKAGAPKLDIPYPSHLVEQGFDHLTENQYQPEGTGEKVGTEVLKALTPLGAVGAAGKLAKGAKEAIPGFVQALYRPSVSNIAATGAGTGAGTYIADKSDSPLTGAGAGALISYLTGKSMAAPKSISGLKNAWEAGAAEAAVRSKGIGHSFLENLPSHLDAPQLEKGSLAKAGEVGVKTAKNYYEKAKPIFTQMKNRAVSKLTPETQNMSIEGPAQWFMDKLIDHPSSEGRNLLLDSELGHFFKKMVGIPAKTNEQGFLNIIKKNPEILQQPRDWKYIDDFRRSVANQLSKGEWGQIGSVDKGQLEKLSGLLGSSLQEGFEKAGKDAGAAWRRYASSYSDFARTKKPHINKTTAQKDFPERAYHDTKHDLAKGGGETREFLLANAKGNDKALLARTYVADLGYNGETFDVPTFIKGWESTPIGLRDTYLKSLPKGEAANIDKMIKVYKRYHKIRGEDKGIHDVKYKQHGLGLASHLKKLAIRSLFGDKYMNVEGQKDIINHLHKGHYKPLKVRVEVPFTQSVLKHSAQQLSREKKG